MLPGVTRKERLQQIRARFEALLAGGELVTMAQERPLPPINRWARRLAAERYVDGVLRNAAWLEHARPPWRGSRDWRRRAETVARELELLGEWAGLSPRPDGRAARPPRRAGRPGGRAWRRRRGPRTLRAVPPPRRGCAPP